MPIPIAGIEATIAPPVGCMWPRWRVTYTLPTSHDCAGRTYTFKLYAPDVMNAVAAVRALLPGMRLDEVEAVCPTMPTRPV